MTKYKCDDDEIVWSFIPPDEPIELGIYDGTVFVTDYSDIVLEPCSIDELEGHRRQPSEADIMAAWAQMAIWPPKHFLPLPGEVEDYDLIDEDPEDDEGALPDPNEDPPACKSCKGDGKCKYCKGHGTIGGFTDVYDCEECGATGFCEDCGGSGY